MPKSRREQKRARREARRKEKRKASRSRSAPRSRRTMLHEALNWPVMECWVNEDWEDPAALNQVVVARRNPMTGVVYASVILVDRACLGVKNAYASNFVDAGQFRRELLSHIRQSQELVRINFNLAAAIVEAGLEYAAQFGFRPHRDYRDASILLKDANPGAVDVEIPVGGEDGKPFFVAGPYDNVDRIIAKLLRQLGPDGFHYLAPTVEETALDLLDEGDWELIEEDGEEALDDGDIIDIELSDGG